MWKRVEARGTGIWVVDRVSVDRSGQNPGRALTGSGQNPGRPLAGPSQKSGSGSDWVRDDVSMTSASGLTRSKNESGQRLGWVR